MKVLDEVKYINKKLFLYIFTANELMLVIYVKDCKDI